MALETSAAIIAVSLALLSVVLSAVLVAVFLFVRRMTVVLSVMEQQMLPLFATLQHTADTVSEIGDAARFQVRRLERLGNRIARLGALYSAVSHGVAVAIATLLKKKEA
ncbi:MAG: hypothetical protein HY207_10195 [Nitrospirae bacterium]|nr:hypothetical protein [Nitrospirota bacterium]